MIADFNKKGKENIFDKKFLFKTAGVLIFIVIIVSIFADFKIYHRKQDLISQIDSYKKQIEDIEKSNRTLKAEIANSDNPEYLEKFAYEQAGEARPDEKVYSFIASQEKPKTTASPENFWASWFSQTWSWLKSKF